MYQLNLTIPEETVLALKEFNTTCFGKIQQLGNYIIILASLQYHVHINHIKDNLMIKD